MKLKTVAEAYLAAEALGREKMPYALALALVQVKKETRDEAQFFLDAETELVRKYAELDENGQPRMTGTGTFRLRGSGSRAAYEAERKELCETESQVKAKPIRVAAPERITPVQLEALEPFLDFQARESEKE